MKANIIDNLNQDRQGLLDRWGAPLLLGWFVLFDILAIVPMLLANDFGGNVQIYHGAARVWLAGGDPWAASYPTTFGPQFIIAPPPSLAPYLLTAWLPVGLATWVWVLADAAAAVLVVRSLRLPMWWVLFPPLAVAGMWGSADGVFLLIFVAGPRWLAAVGKATFIPSVIAERAWRDLAIVGVLLVASLALMPWDKFLSHLSELSDHAFFQSQGGFSAITVPPLALATAVALVLLGWRRGWYLLVPALWPANQIGYATVSMPVLGALPVVAAAVAVPIPLAGPLGIIATAIWLRLRPGISTGRL